MNEQITQAELKELLHYCSDTGVFVWKVDKANTVKAGSIAGTVDAYGYIKIQINTIRYAAHRLAWLYMYGVWPYNQIDHINGVAADNRLCNLREATKAENTQNTGVYENNTSGYTGVTWHKNICKWQARIQIGNTRKHLGYFITPEEAYSVYLQAKKELHTFQPIPRAYICNI